MKWLSLSPDEDLEELSNEELWGEAEWQEMRSEAIEQITQGYREADDEQVFGADKIQEMRQEQIDLLMAPDAPRSPDARDTAQSPK